jgi:iron complex outermembrane receptor protein
VLSIAATSQAQQPRLSGIEALKSLSIRELSEIEVTSVSRVGESLGAAAAAITVVTGEDLLRSGATSIPEALRGLPGIYVGQRNANSWAISSRGFSSINSEKLLVLSDTRSIYTPLFSGVQWDIQNYVMEDLERIEVIRGPGATQWGSNAVNGVINITTKNARDTQGLYLMAGGGNEEQVTLAGRYGGRLGEAGHFRVFGKYFERDASQLPQGANPDDWHMAHLGFRADSEPGTRDAFTVQGDWYHGHLGQVGPAVTIIGRPEPPPPLRAGVRGGNLLARWQRELDAGSNLQLRAYYDRTRRNDPSFTDALDTIDVDFQHHLALATQQLTWGLNYRHTSNTNRGKGVFAVDPPRARDALISGFVQDQIALGDALRLTLGTKLEHNDFSGFEYQPSARLALSLPQAQHLWMSVSRAVRVPTRLERDVAIEVTPPGEDPAAFLLGNRDFDSERLLAWELGYRWQQSTRLSLDLATFLNQYKGLASLEFGAPFTDATNRTVYPIVNQNLTDGRALGAEARVEFLPLDNWRLVASYSYLDLDIDPHGEDANRGQFADGSTPRHQFGLRSALDLGPLRIDAFLRHLTDIRREPQIVSGEGIAGYTELDLRIASSWRELEFALKLRNLLHDHHLEFGAPAQRGEIERSVFASVSWRR